MPTEAKTGSEGALPAAPPSAPDDAPRSLYPARRPGAFSEDRAQQHSVNSHPNFLLFYPTLMELAELEPQHYHHGHGLFDDVRVRKVE